MSEPTEPGVPANDEAGSPSAPATPGNPTPEERLRDAAERIAALAAERDDFKDRWLRAEAETANVRARGRREVEDARQYAAQSFAGDMVEAAENMRRGLASLPPPQPREPETLARLREGFAGIERSFVATLERNGCHARGPDRAAIRCQPAPRDGRAALGRRGAGDGAAGLDLGVAAERAAAEAGDGRGGQGARGRGRLAGRERPSLERQGNRVPPLVPVGPPQYIHSIHRTLGLRAVLRAARNR